MRSLVPSQIDEVFAAIRREREHQKRKYGRDRSCEVGTFITVLRGELREVEDAFCGLKDTKKALEEILQVVAVGVACLEEHGVVERDSISRDPLRYEESATCTCSHTSTGHLKGGCRYWYSVEGRAVRCSCKWEGP